MHHRARSTPVEARHARKRHTTPRYYDIDALWQRAERVDLSGVLTPDSDVMDDGDLWAEEDEDDFWDRAPPEGDDDDDAW